MRWYKFIVNALLFSVGVAHGQSTATVTLDRAGSVMISRNIYGQFAEHLGRCVYDGIYRNGKIRMDVVNALRELHVPNLRWPGGCFADEYHWQDGVGPQKQRPTRVNTTWGMVTEDNSFGTDEFMRFCELIGCEPYIAGNVGTGTPREMAQWLEYLNFNGKSALADMRRKNGHPWPYNVSWWGVGNESWGCGGDMTPEYYADLYRHFASFCESYPGAPALKKIVSGANGDDYHWTEVMLQKIPLELFWGLSLHYYTLIMGHWPPTGSATSFTEKEYFQSLKQALRMQEIVERHEAILDKYDPAKKIALLVDEWGIWTRVEPGTNPSFLYQQNSLRDALIAASTLNIFNNHADRIRGANLAQMVNVLQALILTKGDSLLLTPTYHVFDLYQVHQDARWLPVHLETPFCKWESDSIPAINVSASRDSLGVLHISLVNLDPAKSITVKINLPEPGYLGVTGQILTGNRFTAINTFNRPDVVKPALFTHAALEDQTITAELPSTSVVLLTVR